MNLSDIGEPAKHAGDLLAGVTIVATLLKWMPAIAAVLAVIWTAMRIYESYQNIRMNRHRWDGRDD